MSSFSITYQVTVYDSEEVKQKVEWICLEQSVEVPRDVVSDALFDQVVGQVRSIKESSKSVYKICIEWPLANIGEDPTQFLNLLFGNISLKKGIKVIDIEWGKLTGILKGPGVGIEEMRMRYNFPNRALTCGVLKPLGLNTFELAERAREMARGGIDLIKDDHGLADQTYAPFYDRIHTVVQVLNELETETGHRARYFPHITTSGTRALERYRIAADAGVDGVMVIPHTMGYEVMHEMAQCDIELPIIAHPAFSGALVMDSSHGIAPSVIYGGLFRAFGADCVIYPNTGGRFSFSEEECEMINTQARNEVKGWKLSFPMPGGGMNSDTIANWARKYGNDTIFLIGASLFQHPLGITKAVEELQESLSN